MLIIVDNESTLAAVPVVATCINIAGRTALKTEYISGDFCSKWLLIIKIHLAQKCAFAQV